jgi:hypothetical protein
MPDSTVKPPDAGRRGLWSRIAITASCLALAALSREYLAPQLLRIAADQRLVSLAQVDSRLAQMPGAPLVDQRLSLRRSDQVLVASGDAAVIQSTLTWALPGGASPPLAQTTALYGVGRDDRRLLAGYGDADRVGSYGFPPGAERGVITVWDPYHPGPMTARFEQVEKVAGLEVYRYALEGAEADGSLAYQQLPLVPERYKVRITSNGTAWVEPRTGLVVDREQRGEARFVLAGDGTILGQAHSWRWRFTPVERNAAADAARTLQRELLVLGVVLPLLLAAVAGGALLLGRGAWGAR